MRKVRALIFALRATHVGLMRALRALPFVILAMASWTSAATANVPCTVPNQLVNGTVADATQVMGNYNALTNCLTRAAAAGANNDITALTALVNSITNTNLSQMAANTIKCNPTGALANAQDCLIFPGLTLNVQTTGIPGMDVSGCSTASTCGTMYYAAPSANTVAANEALLRIQKMPTYTGGTSGSTVQALWVLEYTSQNSTFYEWPITSELHNRTLATTNAQNVAINGTAFKEFLAPSTAQIGPTWGGNFVCNDKTGFLNPTASCIGTEIDNYTAVGSGADPNRNRVIVQLVGGVNSGVDAGVHIGRGIFMNAVGGAIIDNAFELQNAQGTVMYTLQGNGAVTITSNLGNWSNANIGQGLIVTAVPTSANPAIGITDLNGANLWAIANLTGVLKIQSMPVLSNSTTAPIAVMQFTSTNVTLPVVPTGTPTASLCLDASNNIIKKTTVGSCI